MFAADKRTVTCAAQKSSLHELFDHQTRLIRVEIPQALKLPVRETQTGTFVELAADALKHGFETGRTGHVGQFGLALSGIGAGSRTPARKALTRHPAEALSGTQPDAGVRRKASRPRLGRDGVQAVRPAQIATECPDLLELDR